MITKEGKRCTCCGEFKLWEEFYEDLGNKDNKTSRCKKCNNIFRKKQLVIIIDNSGRTCTKCLIYKSWNRFNLDVTQITGYHTCCKNCHVASNRKYILRRNYDVSLEWYEDKLKRQNGVCEICKKACATGNPLGVDHNHTTGKNRGLLCSGCNLVLGNCRENPETLRRAAKYLEKYQ